MTQKYLRMNTRQKHPAIVGECPTLIEHAQPSLVVVTTPYGPMAYVHIKLAALMETIERV